MFYQITLSDRQIWFKSLTEDGFLNSCTSISKIIKLKKRIGLRFWNDYAQLHTSERRFQFDDYFLTSSNDIFYFWIWKIETQFNISETLHRQDVCMLESKWYISRLLARPGDKQEGNFAVFSVITTQVSYVCTPQTVEFLDRHQGHRFALTTWKRVTVDECGSSHGDKYDMKQNLTHPRHSAYPGTCCSFSPITNGQLSYAYY